MYDYVCRCSKNTFKRPQDVFFKPLLSKNVTFCPRRFMNGSAMQARLAILSRLTHYTCLALMWSAALFFFFVLSHLNTCSTGGRISISYLGEHFFREAIRSLGLFHCGLLPIGPLLYWARPGCGARSADSATSSRVRSAFFFLAGSKQPLKKQSRYFSWDAIYQRAFNSTRIAEQPLGARQGCIFFYATTNSSPSCLLQRFLSTNAKSAHVVPFDSIF